MARTYKSKNVGTKPSLSGGMNMSKEYDDKHKEKGDDDKGLSFMSDLFKISCSKMGRTSAWTEEDVVREVGGYFDYCIEHELKPYIGGIALYMGMSKSTLYEWMSNPSKHGVKSEIILQARLIIEGQYIDRSEKYPTANLFLLRTSHGHVETSRLDVNATGSVSASAEDIKDAVSKLGLDKK